VNEPRRLLVGFDGSKAACAALDWAEGVARQHHGRLTLVMVAGQPWLAACGWPGLSTAPSRAEVEAAASAILRQAIDELAPDVSVTSLVLSGPVGQALAREARRQDCDLIVIGRGRRLLRPWPGPVERFLQRHSDIPVVTIAAPARTPQPSPEPAVPPTAAGVRPAV
jgi:nucleotide-binding universal stress UspA family protein